MRNAFYTSSALSMIPPPMIGGMQRYIENGIAPGHFLAAVLSNDLMEAFGRADHENAQRLGSYVAFLHNYAPPACYGSREKFEAWCKSGGLVGQGAEECR